MLTNLKRLLWDENYFSQKFRAVIGVVGLLAVSGVLKPEDFDDFLGPRTIKAIGVVLAGIAWWTRAGEKNRTVGEIKEIAG